MLSILIPIYNYDVRTLCSAISNQAVQLFIDFEIIAIEDGSTLFLDENIQLESIVGCSYQVIQTNRGRSMMRNFLADQAQYDNLLFLDCDSGIVDNLFLKRYLESIELGDIVCGDRLYATKEYYPQDCHLNWIYGSKREPKPGQKDRLFLSPNFLIKRAVLNKVRFNPSIETNEDSLFGLDVERHGFHIAYINNPVIHIGLNTNKQYLDKTQQIMRMTLLLEETLPKNEAQRFKMIRIGMKLRQFRLLTLISWVYKQWGHKMYSVLCGASPTLWMYDLYRLSYYCTLLRQLRNKQ